MNHTGNSQPAISQEEHEAGVMPPTKRVLNYGTDGTNKNAFFIDSNGTMRSIVTIASTITTSFGGNVTLNPSPNQIGSVTISHPITTTLGGLVTLAQSPNLIGIVTIANQPALVAGTAQIGSVTIANQPPLIAGTAYVGLASVNIGGTLPALSAGTNFIGLVSTASIHASTDMKTLISGEDQTNDVMKVEGQFSYTSFISVSTVAIKAAAGFVHLFNIGAPSCPTTIFYDSVTCTGTKVHTLSAGYPMGSHPLDIKFTTGISIDTFSSGGGVVPQILVAWR
jgi:hypothetical protein